MTKKRTPDDEAVEAFNALMAKKPMTEAEERAAAQKVHDAIAGDDATEEATNVHTFRTRARQKELDQEFAKCTENVELSLARDLVCDLYTMCEEVLDETYPLLEYPEELKQRLLKLGEAARVAMAVDDDGDDDDSDNEGEPS